MTKHPDWSGLDGFQPLSPTLTETPDTPLPATEINEKPMTTSQDDFAKAVDKLTAILKDKNRKYGNSALEPLRVHSKASPIEQLKVRADDKLSRIQSSQDDDTEDALLDYIGYMILLYIAQHNK